MAIPAPLFRDPIFDGAADPTIIWNREEKTWWLLYTNRRATTEGPDVAWVHGTEIGIASSAEGQNWLYRGTLQGLEFERGRNTFWAPEVLWNDGRYHMYVSYVRGIPSTWKGGRSIVHMVSDNLWDWQFQSILPLSSDRVIDACVYRKPDGPWQMWYKDEDNHSHTYAATSPDLWHWQVNGPVITDCAHEGPNVFRWQGSYWMITDPWRGLDVYRSKDLQHWTKETTILNIPGSRKDDAAIGHHADVLVQGEKAYIFYFTHPEIEGMAGADFVWSYRARRTSLQAAELEIRDERLLCDRNRPFDLNLLPGVEG